MRLKSLIKPSVLFLSLTAAATPAVALEVAPGGQAASPDEAGDVAANAVSAVVVTANRAPLAATQVGQSFTVLTASHIHLDQETNLADLLARTPGISLARNGGPGQTTSIFIRGADSDQTVVLLDGVKLNDPTATGDGYDFSSLITGDAARIEVLRGSQSTLYGTEAIGGVVNIMTADATKPIEAELQAEGGSYGTGYARGAVGGKMDRIDWRLGAYYDTTASVSAFDKAFGGKETDGFQSSGYTGRLRVDLTPDLQLDERAYYSRSRTDFDGYDTPTYTFGDDGEWGRVTQVLDYTGLNLSLLDGRLKNRLAYEYSGVDRLDIDPGSTPDATFTGVGRTYTVEYEGAFAITPDYQAVFGAQTERSSMITASPAYFSPTTRAHATITSGYGQLTGEVIPGLTLTGGVRYDQHSAYGGHVTGQASVAWKLNNGDTILRASFGEGFKAPSLYQLYSEYGNPALEPEQSESWDAGVEQHFLDGRVVLQATFFGRQTRDLIDFVSCYGEPTSFGLCGRYQTFLGYYDNIAKAWAQGVELQAAWQVTRAFSVSANYTYDDVEDRSPGSPTFGQQLARRPKNTANLAAAYVWPFKLRTEAAVRYAGDSYNELPHVNRLHAYALVDLRVSYPLRDNVEVYARIENLADEHYETVYQYGTLGRAAYGGVSLKF
jgi:vitamin B12 transporter